VSRNETIAQTVVANMNKMKKLTLILLIGLLSFSAQAQEDRKIPDKFPTEFDSNFTFPLGSKIILELKKKKNGKYEYSVLSVDKIEGYYSLESDENLFEPKPKENTVEIFFMGAFYNEGKEDKDWKTLLMMRNNLKTPINYKADIKFYFKEEFENTSIVGAFPNVKTNEIWAHKIDFITLYDFVDLKM
tara:strand:- start:227 stop:790 length:564 start_codon:yes stop_codon:yes gene_type:complete